MLLLVILPLISVSNAQTSVVNGVAQYEGTPVSTLPAGIPTLTYNCAKLPSICENVNNRYTLNQVTVNGRRYRSTLAGNSFIELNIDYLPPTRPGESLNRNDIRREEVCPRATWKNTHACPEPNQPLVVPGPGGSSVSNGFVGSLLVNTGSYAIANNGMPAGMTWTCDEFPPRIAVEGGTERLANGQRGRSASTFCAPWGQACNGVGYVATEQNFQGFAHDFVADNCQPSDQVKKKNQPGTSGVWNIHFNTVFEDESSTWATAVSFYLQDPANPGQPAGPGEAALLQPWGRRKRADSKVLVTRHHHQNGTVADWYHEVPMNHGMPDGIRDGLSVGNISALERAGYRRLGQHLHAGSLQKRQDETLACTDPDDPNPPDPDVSSSPGQSATSASATSSSTASVSPPLHTTGIAHGLAVKPGTELRILPVGDSLTVGFESSLLNGYRLELQNDLSADNLHFAGTESGGSMCDGYFAAWSGKTIHFISENIAPSLAQRPNIILLHAGTNDMNSRGAATEGDDPNAAAGRLGALIDQMIAACPDATILVAMIIPTIQTAGESSPGQEDRTMIYNSLIPGIVAQRAAAGSHVITVDFSQFPLSALNTGGIHLTDGGYSLMGDWWYDFLHQIPTDWINAPVGADPQRPPCHSVDSGANGGPDPNIPAPSFPPSIIQPSSKAAVSAAANAAGTGGEASCKANPVWSATGQIALGLGRTGAFQYTGPFQQAGQLAEGIHLGSYPVHLADINNDGRADYLWVDPNNGRLIAWLNNLPGPWSPAGSDGGVIADGAGAGNSVFFADMNGDGFADYLVVDQNTGSVTCYWNYGADSSAEHGWRFVPGGVIATGVPHANLATLRFPDINGDGRADYVIIGTGGSLGLWLNTGQPGSQDVLFQAQGGIASGASPNINNIIFADLDGDGRDDYLLWDNNGGLTGFLNQPTEKAGLPFYIQQSSQVASGIGQDPALLRLADLDGDGKDDYVYVDNENGALWVWWNRGHADDSMAADGVRFADIDGDGLDDYIWLDPLSGAPIVYINAGPSSSDSLGWSWVPVNGGNPVATGAGAAFQVQFADIDGDGKADYLVVDPKTGALSVWINANASSSAIDGYQWNPVGQIAAGLGPGANKNIRFADIDGDGRADYIYLHPNGGTTIYRNQYRPNTPNTDWIALPSADAAGIGQRPEEISFHDINGDGKADYIWTNSLDSSVSVWLNNYPQQPTWLAQGQIFGGTGETSRFTQWAKLQDTGRASLVAVQPSTGAISAWLNGCDNRGPAPTGNCGERPRADGNTLIYLWTMVGDLDCSEVGSTKVCPPPFYGTSIAASQNWNCDWLGGPSSSSQPDVFLYPENPPPVIEFETGGCGGRELNITFTRFCDATNSWLATTDSGGRAICDTSELPNSASKICDITGGTLSYIAHLSCRGNICA